MPDLASHSLAELRAVARRLEIPGASALAKSELLAQLTSQRDAAIQLLEVTGRSSLVIRGPAPAAMSVDLRTTEEASPSGVRDGLPSGIGREAQAPLVEPKVPIADLPWAYEDDRVVLLARDPRTLFGYWDFHPDTVRRAADGLIEPRALLRLWRLGGAEPAVVREFEVSLEGRSYYLFDNEPNTDYRIELIFRGAGGDERLLGRHSNIATLPPNKPSAWVEDRFATVSLEGPLTPPIPHDPSRQSEGERRLHGRAYELSGGEETPVGDEASSSRGIAQGFGGRSWSGTLVRK